jgi:long-chain acyl-CoA synthetase
VLYTGDLFRTDEDGFLYFVGRADDIIKSRGEKISPKEVEDVLYALTDIGEAAVIGMPDPVLGQAIKAVVVPRAGASLDVREIIAHCKSNLEEAMVPKIVEIRPFLPKTRTGKIDKKGLR